MDLQVVLQVLSNRHHILFHRDAVLFQFCGRTDAGQHEQLWRLDRTAADDDFTAGTNDAHLALMLDAYTRGTLVLQQYLFDQGVGEQVEVAARHRRSQMSNRGAAAAAIPDGAVQSCHAFGLVAVQIVGLALAGLLAGFE